MGKRERETVRKETIYYAGTESGGNGWQKHVQGRKRERIEN